MADGDAGAEHQDRRGSRQGPENRPGETPVRPGGQRRAGERHDRVERVGEVGRGLEALVGVLLEDAADDAVEGGRQRRLDRGRVLLGRRREDLGRGTAGEGRRAGEHLVEHGAEREQVRARVGRRALDALGCDVAGGAEQRLRERGAVLLGQQAVGDGAAAQPGEAEVEDLHAPVGGEDDVRRLEVVVQDRAGVGGRESLCDLDRDLDGPTLRQPAAGEPLLQRLALDELEHDVGHVALAADVVDADDRGVVDRRSAARASCSNRRSRSGWRAASKSSSLIATSRPRRVSRARCTSDMPPTPSGDSSS